MNGKSSEGGALDMNSASLRDDLASAVATPHEVARVGRHVLNVLARKTMPKSFSILIFISIYTKNAWPNIFF
jgi:hypothetical protein